MKIINKCKNPYVQFSELEAGEVFLMEEDGTYMKLAELVTTSLDWYANCVNLASGSLYHFTEDDFALRVEAEVTIS